MDTWRGAHSQYKKTKYFKEAHHITFYELSYPVRESSLKIQIYVTLVIKIIYSTRDIYLWRRIRTTWKDYTPRPGHEGYVLNSLKSLRDLVLIWSFEKWFSCFNAQKVKFRYSTYFIFVDACFICCG